MKAQSRRTFLRHSFAFLSAVFATSALGGLVTEVFAAPKKKKEIPLPPGAVEVPTTDPVATAIGYVPVAAAVDKKANPTYKKGQNCLTCSLYTKSNEGWGKCQLITTGLVRADGWCRSYSKKV